MIRDGLAPASPTSSSFPSTLARPVATLMVATIPNQKPTPVSASASQADALDKGNAALTRGDYAEAMRWLRVAADQGSAMAEQNIGYMYYNGFGVSQDYAEAAVWYRRAAEQGLAVGESSIGWLYQNGLGVPRDYDEALRWNRKAVDQGDMNGEQNLGRLYLWGLGVPKDKEQARYLFGLAAAQGSREEKSCCLKWEIESAASRDMAAHCT
jgi:TPR repeat protein